MAQVLTPTSDDIAQLNNRRSAEVLNRALDASGSVRILVSFEDREIALSGFLTGREETALLIELDDQSLPESHERLNLDAASLHITLESGSTPFFFHSRCMGQPKLPQTRMMRVETPVKLWAIERRIYNRQNLKEPMTVTLKCAPSDNDWHCTGAMLNAGPSGMACRIRSVDANRLTRSTNVEVSMRIGSPPESLVLMGRVMNVTRGATPETTVLGMEFPDPRNSEGVRNRFRQWLQDID